MILIIDTHSLVLRCATETHTSVLTNYIFYAIVGAESLLGDDTLVKLMIRSGEHKAFSFHHTLFVNLTCIDSY